MAGVKVVSLHKAYGFTPVLRGLELAIAERELVTLLGPSGCGKTTTLRCIAGLERPEQGEIHIGSTLVSSSARGVFVPPNRRDVGMVFQSYALWPHMSVFANVAYPLRVRRLPRRQLEPRVREALAAVGMEDYAQRGVTELSGGQQQRVALARALVARPSVLLLDEPLSNLDAKLRAQLRKEIRAAHERAETTSVYVTHDQVEAIALSDRVVVLNQGEIQQVGTPAEIYRRPANRFVAEFVGFENLLPAIVTAAGSGTAAVLLEGSRSPFPVDAPPPEAGGRRMLVAVRAEDLRLTRAEALNGGLPGRVVSRAYAGERWECVVAAGDRSLVVRHPAEDDRPPAPGEPVTVVPHPGRVVLLPAPDAAPEAEPIRIEEDQNALC